MNPRLRPTLPLWPDFDPKITHFWGPLVHNWSMAKAKTASNQLGICPWKMHARPIPKVSIFMAVTAKKVTERLKNRQKWQDFGQKRAIMAGSWHGRHFFNQCLWVTKFCAKFGRSRIPRTTTAHNYFIVFSVCESSQPLWKNNLKYVVKLCSYFLWQNGTILRGEMQHFWANEANLMGEMKQIMLGKC